MKGGVPSASAVDDNGARSGLVSAFPAAEKLHSDGVYVSAAT